MNADKSCHVVLLTTEPFAVAGREVPREAVKGVAALLFIVLAYFMGVVALALTTGAISVVIILLHALAYTEPAELPAA